MARPATKSPPAKRAIRWRRHTVWIALVLAVGGLITWGVLDARRAERDEAIRLALAGDLKAAEPLLTKILARSPDDADAWRALALGRIARGQLAEAVEPLDRWRALRSADPDPHLNRIDLAVKMNRPAEAIDPARAALALRPDSGDLREKLAFWLYQTGETAEADAECRRCRESRDSLPLKMLHAEIARRLGDNKRAEKLVADVLAAGQRTPPVLTLAGAVALDLGDPAQAIPLLKEAINKGGEGQGRARHYLSLALARSGDEEGAKRVLAEDMRLRAINMWEKYGRADGVGYLVTNAEGMLATGQAEQALQLLKLVLEKDPNCRAAHKLLADYHETRGQSALAADHRRKAEE